jgi:hypothetical protein
LPLHRCAIFQRRVQSFQNFGGKLHPSLVLHLDPCRTFQQVQFSAQLASLGEPSLLGLSVFLPLSVISLQADFEFVGISTATDEPRRGLRW